MPNAYDDACATSLSSGYVAPCIAKTWCHKIKKPEMLAFVDL
ncbi:hypothetical protein ALT716_110104 [Alteromonas macleodii]